MKTGSPIEVRGTRSGRERRRLYEASAGPYAAVANRHTLFVERVEMILTKEGAEFYARHAKNEETANRRDTQG